MDAEIITHNPATQLKLPNPDTSIEHYLTRDEQQALIDAHEEPFDQALCALLIDTGLRWGEATALHGRDVDLTRRTVRVRNAWSRTELRPYTKSKRRRTVPLTQRSAALLEHLMPEEPSQLIFSRDGRSQLDLDNWRRRRHEVALRAARLPHTRIHDLRHTYASTLLQAGIPLAEVGRLLGHLNTATTARYAHLASTPSAAVLAALGDKQAPGGDQPGPTSPGANVGQPENVDRRDAPQTRSAEIIDFATKRQIS